jgi:LysR family glycine cleavage system transcriptional activator
LDHIIVSGEAHLRRILISYAAYYNSVPTHRPLQAAGVADAETSHGLTLNRASMLIDAAVDGQGVALARTTLAAWDLINGRLSRPFDVGLKLARTYWIVCPKATSTKPKVATFRDWLLAEAADDARRLRKIFAS